MPSQWNRLDKRWNHKPQKQILKSIALEIALPLAGAWSCPIDKTTSDGMNCTTNWGWSWSFVFHFKGLTGFVTRLEEVVAELKFPDSGWKAFVAVSSQKIGLQLNLLPRAEAQNLNQKIKVKANPLTALSWQPGLLGRAVLPQLLDIPEQTARQVEATMCLHVSAISKCLAHLCSNFGPEQKRTPECVQFWMLTSATNNLNIEESIEKGSNMKYIEIWHPWITNCQWHRPFRAKALGTELLALQLSTQRSFLPTSGICNFLGAATLGAHDDNLFRDVSSCFISFICCSRLSQGEDLQPAHGDSRRRFPHLSWFSHIFTVWSFNYGVSFTSSPRPLWVQVLPTCAKVHNMLPLRIRKQLSVIEPSRMARWHMLCPSLLDSCNANEFNSVGCIASSRVHPDILSNGYIVFWNFAASVI